MSQITQADLDALAVLLANLSTNQQTIYDAQKVYIDGKDQETASSLHTRINSEVSTLNNAITTGLNGITLNLPAGFSSMSDIAAAIDNDPSFAATIRSELSNSESALTIAVNAEKARVDAILSASAADKDSFAEIVSLINSIDTENDNAFAAYVLSNNAALAQEIADRQSAVTALTSTVASNKTEIESSVASLTSTVASNKTEIEASLASEETRATAAEQANAAAITQEIADRQYAVNAARNDSVVLVNNAKAECFQQDLLLKGMIDAVVAEMDGFKDKAVATFALV
jgi:hypothetical protein